MEFRRQREMCIRDRAKAADLVGADHALLISRSHKTWSSQGVVSLGLGDALAFLLDRSEAP